MHEEILEFLPYIDFNCFSLSGIITMCAYLENQQKIMEKVTYCIQCISFCILSLSCWDQIFYQMKTVFVYEEDKNRVSKLGQRWIYTVDKLCWMNGHLCILGIRG